MRGIGAISCFFVVSMLLCGVCTPVNAQEEDTSSYKPDRFFLHTGMTFTLYEKFEPVELEETVNGQDVKYFQVFREDLWEPSGLVLASWRMGSFLYSSETDNENTSHGKYYDVLLTAGHDFNVTDGKIYAGLSLAFGEVLITGGLYFYETQRGVGEYSPQQSKDYYEYYEVMRDDWKTGVFASFTYKVGGN